MVSFVFSGLCRCTSCYSKDFSAKLGLWSTRDNCQASGKHDLKCWNYLDLCCLYSEYFESSLILLVVKKKDLRIFTNMTDVKAFLSLWDGNSQTRWAL